MTFFRKAGKMTEQHQMGEKAEDGTFLTDLFASMYEELSLPRNKSNCQVFWQCTYRRAWRNW